MNEEEYRYTMEYYLSIKKEITATCIYPDIIILSKSERERQIPYDMNYIWSLKYDTSEPIYETETDSRT